MPVSDPVDRPPTAPDPRLTPWRAFLLAHARVSRRLDEDLRLEHDLSIAEYDTLLTLALAPGRRMRMGPIAEHVILSKSGVTRLIDRLVSDELVERSACLADARGAEAVLTDRGLARLREASPTHLRGVSEHFLALLDQADLDVIERTMSAVAERAGPGEVDRARCTTDGADLSAARDQR